MYITAVKLHAKNMMPTIACSMIYTYLLKPQIIDDTFFFILYDVDLHMRAYIFPLHQYNSRVDGKMMVRLYQKPCHNVSLPSALTENKRLRVYMFYVLDTSCA